MYSQELSLMQANNKELMQMCQWSEKGNSLLGGLSIGSLTPGWSKLLSGTQACHSGGRASFCAATPEEPDTR